MRRDASDDFKASGDRVQRPCVFPKRIEVQILDELAREIDVVQHIAQDRQKRSEGTNGVDYRGRFHIRLQSGPIDDIDSSIKHRCDVFFHPRVIEDGDMRIRIEFDHDVSVAVLAFIASGSVRLVKTIFKSWAEGSPGAGEPDRDRQTLVQARLRIACEDRGTDG